MVNDIGEVPVAGAAGIFLLVASSISRMGPGEVKGPYKVVSSFFQKKIGVSLSLRQFDLLHHISGNIPDHYPVLTMRQHQVRLILCVQHHLVNGYRIGMLFPRNKCL